MKKIITFFTLMLCMFATAQEVAVGKYLYIYHSDKSVEQISVSEIDSLKFVDAVIVPSQDSLSATSQYVAVDLGLPSGIKWASCNVGATAPEEFGNYYAWGEVEEKKDYTWETYKWCNGSDNAITKYCGEENSGNVDNKTILEPEDDVAQKQWGSNWRMPTDTEIKELVEKCDWVRTTLNNVQGYKITGTNGNSIFLPFAGYCTGAELHVVGLCGYYWGSVVSASSYAAGSAILENDTCRFNYDKRCYGFTVRPVCE